MSMTDEDRYTPSAKPGELTNEGDMTDIPPDFRPSESRAASVLSRRAEERAARREGRSAS